MEIQKLFDLNIKVDIITGGATHLGFALALGLGELGLILSRREDLCMELGGRIENEGHK